jgi:hypothetical protein
MRCFAMVLGLFLSVQANATSQLFVFGSVERVRVERVVNVNDHCDAVQFVRVVQPVRQRTFVRVEDNRQRVVVGNDRQRVVVNNGGRQRIEVNNGGRQRIEVNNGGRQRIEVNNGGGRQKVVVNEKRGFLGLGGSKTVVKTK